MSKSKTSLGLWMTVVVGVMVMVVNAAEAALPGTVSSRVKTINTTLDQAEKSLEGNRLSTAERKVADAQRTLKEINDRYAGKFAADDPDYTAAVERLAAVAAKVEAAGKAAAGADDAKKKAQADNDALCKQWIDKLGPFVDGKSDQYLRLGLVQE